MKGLVVSAIVALCLGSIPGPASSQMGVPSVTGTCNSIGYSDRCCPTVPPTDCHATDGNCDCSTNCHRFGDCCMDNSCDRYPTTCQAAGITQCCTESVSGNSMCDVFHNRTFHCSCQESCHRMNNCCPDIDTIGCPRPQTCYNAGKQAGCCRWSSTSSCYVGGGDCYCDSYCIAFGDCCSDVPVQCTATVSMWKSHYNTAALSHLEHELRALHEQQLEYHLQRPGPPPSTYPGYDHHRLAVIARTERVRANIREFGGKARARVAARPPNRARYNYNYNY